MRDKTMKKRILKLGLAPIVLLLLTAATAFAAAPGITNASQTFSLVAQDAYLNSRTDQRFTPGATDAPLDSRQPFFHRQLAARVQRCRCPVRH